MLKLTFGLLLVAGIASAGLSSKSNEQNGNSVKKRSVEMDVPRVAEFCDEREDGLYVIGCNNTFTRCYNKNTYSVACPGNLYYDYMRGQCEYKETIKECQNEKQYKNKVLKTPADFVCGNRTNGLYAREELPCDRQYFSCDNGIVRKMNCPDRQFFDEGKQRCEYAGRVPACKVVKMKASGYMPVAPAVQEAVGPYGTLPGDAPPAPPPAKDIQAVEVEKKEDEETPDCHLLGDGVYAALSKCSNHFWKCANDRIFKYECQKNLFYDSEITRCDHKEFIPECGGTRPETTPTPENSAPVKIDFDCTGKNDGYHVKEPCTPFFYSCVGGIAISEGKCGATLVYDVRVSACDYIETCKGDRTTAAPPVIGAHGNAVPVETKPSVTLPPFTFDCKNKADGYYTIAKCQNEYAACSSEVAHRYQCQTGLVYDDVSGHCDYKEACLVTKPTFAPAVPVAVTDVPVESQPVVTGYGLPAANEPIRPQIQPAPVLYGGVPVEPQTPAPPATKNPYLPPVEATTKPVQPVIPPVDKEFCTGKPNGDHPWKKCSPEFISCWDGIARRHSCTNQLYFNSFNGQCDYYDNVEGCSGKARATTTTTAAPVTAPPAPAQTVPGYGAPAQTVPGYGAPAQNLPEYGTPAQTVPGYGAPIQQQDRPAPVTTTTAAPAPRNTFCDNKKDGGYADGCNSYFYVCIDQSTRKMNCGGQLFYNAAESKCDHKELVPECGATTTTTTTTQATPVVQTPGGYGFPGQDKPSVAVEKPFPYCELLEDGSYGEGCNVHYYTCVNRATYRMNCPAGLFYSVGVHRCDLKENIDECGGNTPKTTTPAPQPVITPAPVNVYGRQPVETPAEPTKPTKAAYDCSGKKDGLYDLPECTGSFIQCYQGKKYDQECAAGLFYNVANGMCDYKENVPVCGGSLPTTTAAPVVSQPKQPVYGQPAYIAPATGPYGEPVTQPASPAPPTETKPNFNCANQKDGYYSNGCARNYYSCSNGDVHEHWCATTNIRYSAELKRCDIPEYVTECGGTAPTVPPTPEGSAAQPQPQLPKFDCSKLADGSHAFATCSPFYVVCQSGNSLIGSCQNDLIYDFSAGRCLYKEDVAECNPQQTPVEPTVAVLPPTPSDKCAQLADGHYLLSTCATSFIVCKNHVSSIQYCPQGQIVNHKTGRCDQPQNVPGCAPSVPVAPVAPVQPGYGFQTQVVQQPSYGYQTQPNYAPPPPVQSGYGISQQAPALQPYGTAPMATPAQQSYGYQQWGYGK